MCSISTCVQRLEFENQAINIPVFQLDADLARKLEQWQEEHGEAFTIFGNNYAEFIRQQWDAYKLKLQREKEDRKLAKEQDSQPATGVLGKRKNDARQASAKETKARVCFNLFLVSSCTRPLDGTTGSTKSFFLRIFSSFCALNYFLVLILQETHGSAQIGINGLMERSPKAQRLGQH